MAASTLAAAPTGAAAEADTTPLGRYLIDRLSDLGVRHAFGIPGDYVLSFFKLLEHSPIETVVTTSELAAGYAADAYARVNGIGLAVVTYAVGGFSLANACACAYAEKSPVVIVSGAPGAKELRRKDWLLHHTVGGHKTQQEVFEKLTVANCVLDDPLTAFREVDRVLAACLRHKRPVYIELPRDRVNALPTGPHAPAADAPASDPDELREAVAEATGMLRASKSPVIIAGIELNRFKLADPVVELAEAANVPIASTILSKSVVRENHPLYAGVYQAGMGRPAMTKFIEDSDCVLMLGAMMTDVDTGIFTHNLDEGHVIFATSESVRIRYHHYRDVLLEDFVRELCRAELPRYARPLPRDANPLAEPWVVKAAAPITARRVLQKINSVLDRNLAVIADPGDALFGAADLTVHGSAEFLGSAFYATLGWAVPAAIGAQRADPATRPVVLVGDGAFQMTGLELGTTRRGGFSPVVIVLNNKGYLTEKFLLEGKFNDIPDWNYHKLPEVIGAGKGYDVRTEGDFDKALDEALAGREAFCLLNVHLAPDDCSPALKRLGESLSKRV